MAEEGGCGSDSVEREELAAAALVRWRRIRHGDGCRGVAFLLPIGDNVKIEYK